MLLPLQKGIIYGPVRSRRLGWSLGINLLSTQKKICTFNCVYCQYGWTAVHGKKITETFQWPSVAEVLAALEEALRNINSSPAYITFSGNGEPTGHPNFDEIGEAVIRLRNRFSPHSKTAILSNSSLVTDSRIRDAIAKLDVRIMKLDCGNEEIFQKYNFPCCGIDLKDIINALQSMQDITIQALFTGGVAGNYDSAHLDEWIEKIKQISPIHVQLYTLDRDYPSNNIHALEKDDLHLIQKRLEMANVRADVY